jgi:hypothetical protein
MRYRGFLSQLVTPKVLHGKQCISKHVEYTSGDAIATPLVYGLQRAAQHIPHYHEEDFLAAGEVHSPFWETQLAQQTQSILKTLTSER